MSRIIQTSKLKCISVALLLLASKTAFSQQSLAGLAVDDCLVEAIDDNQISAGADGILSEMTVEEGMTVSANQVIAMIDPIQARLNLTLKQAEEEQARLQAENDVNIRAAKKSSDKEIAEAKSAEELYGKQAMPYWDFRREILEAERSKLAIEMAQNDKLVADATYAAKQAETELAKHEIVKRQIRATFGGIVAIRYGKEGEWVQAGTPIVRVVGLDTVKVEGDVEALTFPERVVLGAPVKIRVRVGADQTVEFDSKLEYVSPILEADNTKRVWAKIQNRIEGGRYLVSPGMQAEMVLLPTVNASLN